MATDYSESRLVQPGGFLLEREPCSIFLGTTFLSVRHTHANANLIQLERRHYRLLEYGKAPSLIALRSDQNAET